MVEFFVMRASRFLCVLVLFVFSGKKSICA